MSQTTASCKWFVHVMCVCACAHSTYMYDDCAYLMLHSLLVYVHVLTEIPYASLLKFTVLRRYLILQALCSHIYLKTPHDFMLHCLCSHIDKDTSCFTIYIYKDNLCFSHCLGSHIYKDTLCFTHYVHV